MGKNMLVDGEWQTEVGDWSNEDGEFERQESAFHGRIGDGFTAEQDRYHLYISRACPWAHGAVLVRELMGLDGITLDVVDPFRADHGWQFTPGKDGCTTDRLHGADHLYELYQRADPDYTGRVTVPLLWDREQDTAVNNESIEIMRMLCESFDGDVNFYPEQHRSEIDNVVDDLYETVNNAVYRAGFAGSQAAYDRAIDTLFDALDSYDDRLSDQRFLVAGQLTLADLRLFATLVRFDAVYHTHFMCNVRQIADYEHLSGFLRDIHQLDGVAGTVNMDHIREHYYRTHPDINPKRIIARGPELGLDAPHDRDELPGTVR